MSRTPARRRAGTPTLTPGPAPQSPETQGPETQGPETEGTEGSAGPGGSEGTGGAAPQDEAPAGPGATDAPLRVGLVVDDTLDRPDGVQQYVLTLGRWLTARGHEVHYVTPASSRTDLPHLHVLGRTVPVTFNGNRLGTPLPVPRAQAEALLRELDLDVVHVQMPYSPALAGRLVAAAPASTAVVGTFHIYPQSPVVAAGTRALGTLERRRLARFDAVLAVSEAAQEFARHAFGIDTAVVGNPVEVARFEVHDDHPLVSRARAAAHVAFLGRLVDRKGPRELVRALVRLHQADPARGWTAAVAGRGPLLDELRRLAADGGIADRVTFPGFLAEEDKAAFLADADVVVLPSTGGESFGISVVEALAAARGVVLAGDNPGYRTVMRGLEDQLVDPREPAALAATLDRWLADLDDDVTREQVVARQREAAWRFDVATVGAQVEATYRRALAARRG